jgi:PAS domain S-box-containing protein
VDGAITFVNRSGREFFGVSNEQLHGAGWLQLLHPDDVRRYVETFRLAVKRRTDFRAEGRVRRVDGEWQLIDSHAEPRFSETGEFLGHVGVSSDITDRRREEQALQFQLTLTRAILEVSLDGILVVSNENRIVSHNRRFIDEIFRIPLKEIPYNLPDYWIGDQPPPVLSEVVKRVSNPHSFLCRINELNSDPDRRDHSEI